MQDTRVAYLVLALLLTSACSGGGQNNNQYNTAPILAGNTAPAPTTLAPSTVAPGAVLTQNATTITVGCGYVNEPCVSVTICNPDTNSCLTVNNVLLDTGSYGLRIFSSVIQSLALTAAKAPNGNQVAECVQFLDNTSEWGPVAMAKVQIGGEMTAQPVPIQIIDRNFPVTTAAATAKCPNPDVSPAQIGFNGILGVGLFVGDCGAGCGLTANNQMYFSCSTAGTCTGLAVPEGAPGQNLAVFQVSNPVAYMPTDNNGVVVNLPAVPSTGATGATGVLYLGIGTQTNNTGNNLAKFKANNFGNFTTTFAGAAYQSSFIDSGSNGLYFPAGTSGLTADATGWYNPAMTLTLTATQSDGTTSQDVTFQIGPAASLLAQGTPNVAFTDIGAPLTMSFDWGLPFFFNRSVYVGISGTKSNLGTGPYWAY